ncbi:metal ABC transporter permease [Gandjariella thermophila]|uniref:High-affinity zinc uptake system membrane protein ZnuB n=1 Tax=Gandjariella thermophila TaxID=1931992 RepID=A0A4D4JGY4_9PSEU|nr:metal ABC transporter permease [Gandjariella thermophila]GDY33163.1 ABC transporter permease [Gandjariella thermophila]
MVPGEPGPSWNPIIDLQLLWSFPFMVNAFRAGTIVAVLAGLIGWFMVLRRQSFAGHTVAVAGFPGAAGATLLGVAPVFGYFGFCLAAAAVIAALPRGRDAGYREESAVTGTVNAFALACGYLFIALYKGFLGGVNALLFGNFLGITDDDVLALLAVAVVALAVLAAVGRPLLFASVDPDVAAARGVPVRALSVVFLMLLGAAVAEASQITGTLLVFALLVMPAATAQRLTARPVASLALTVLIGIVATWLGLGIAYFSPYPIGFCVTTVAFAGYLLAHAARAGRFGLPRPRLAGGAT